MSVLSPNRRVQRRTANEGRSGENATAYAGHKSLRFEASFLQLQENLGAGSVGVCLAIGLIGELPRQKNVRLARGHLLGHLD